MTVTAMSIFSQCKTHLKHLGSISKVTLSALAFLLKSYALAATVMLQYCSTQYMDDLHYA